ncbi:MAG: hypothetical protein PG981_001394 [Wolbachia endosymbiont of Ctenocephalides orientis wCori]|nr:MAG: hypothetical protein PG981_001394 [Wolbachia endosymbiont of Ctenocephalides orientis wCori]
MITYIHKLIDENQGSISISAFMNAALYHKEYGYYMSKAPLGKNGDFITAPEISQLFGEIVAVWIIYMWNKLGKPEQFSLVELGPGRGTLIKDILGVTKKYADFFGSMCIQLVEVSPILQEIQEKTLKGEKVNWHKDIDNLSEKPTIFLANEFFDALPIDQFVYRDGRWYENRIVKQESGGLKIVEKMVSSQCLTSSVAENRSKIQCSYSCESSTKMTELFNDAVVEVCQFGIETLEKLEKQMYNNRGAALIVDYGYVYSTYKNTLQSIKQHKYSNFLENVGESDITALVNFQVLKDSLKHAECEILTQREFLYSFGIRERVQNLMKNANDVQKDKISSEFLRLTENMGTLFKAMTIECL